MIELAARWLVNEMKLENENSAGLWARFLTNIESIPDDKYMITSEVVLRACDILEEDQSCLPS